MKKTINLFGIVLFIILPIFLSCNKKSENNLKSNNPLNFSSQISYNAGHENVWLQLSNLTTENAKKLAYSCLSTDEARYCWVRHIETKSSMMNLNTQQTAVVQNLLSNVEVLEPVTVDNIEFYKQQETDWLLQAKLCFSYNQMYSLAYTLDNNVDEQPEKPSNNPGGGGGPAGDVPPDCPCSLNSSMTCSFNLFTCKEAFACTKKTKGCGWFWGSACTGLCFPN
jgi:hypothetical protein